MKITKTKTVVGEWLDFEEPVTENDLEISVRWPEFNEYSKAYQAQVTVRPNEAATAELASVEEDRGLNRFPLLSAAGFTRPVYASRGEVDDPSKYRTWIDLQRRVALKGVKLESTRLDRHAEAKAEVEAMLDSDSEVYREKIGTLIESMNQGIARYVDETNARVLTLYEQNLSGYEGWAKYADKKVDVSEELGEIESIEAKIEELKKQSDAVHARLREKRAEAWLKDWESDDWNWNPGEGRYRMPEAMIEKTREMIAEGKAFNVKPKHRRGIFMD